MEYKKLMVLCLVTCFMGAQQEVLATSSDGWGWPEVITMGALVGIGGAIAGKVVHDVAQSASTSWNHSYITAVRDRGDGYARQYGCLIDTIRFSANKKILAYQLVQQYRSVSRLIYDVNCAVNDFDGVISGLKSKINEWQSQESRLSMFHEGCDVLENAYPLQRMLHEANNSLQSQCYYLVLYSIVCSQSPELRRCENYPYHVLLNDLDGAKNELMSAMRSFGSCCLDPFDQEVLEKARIKLNYLNDAYAKVIESAQYHHEKLEKLREQRHKELMEAQRRLEQAERERAAAERELAAAQRERARAEWERQERDLARLKHELRELEEQRDQSAHPSYDYVGISVHIDV